MVKSYRFDDAIQLTEHFNSAEFRCQHSSRHDYLIDDELVYKLEELFTKIPELFGVIVSKIIVTSGYRCGTHDLEVGGYGSGPHVEGYGADICVYDDSEKPVDSRLVCCAAQELGFRGIANITSAYIYTHLDTKDRKTASGKSYKWYGNEVHGNGTVTDDFWTYFGLTKKTGKSNAETVELRGIDVSQWQGTIDFKAAAPNIDFVIIRAGYGRELNQIDTRWEQNYAGFRQQDTPIGAYWYSYADSAEDARREANTCLEALKGKKFELPIFYDILEDDHIPILKKAGTISKLINEIIPAFCEVLEKNGYFVGVYCSASRYRYLNDSNKQRYVQWVADWRGSCGYTGEKVLWQYSSKGTVPGIKDAVDKDYAYTDFAIIKEKGFNGWNSEEYQKTTDSDKVQNPAVQPVNKEEPTPEEAMSIFEQILKEVQEINKKLGK